MRNSGGTRTVVGVRMVIALSRVVAVKLKESEQIWVHRELEQVVSILWQI